MAAGPSRLNPNLLSSSLTWENNIIYPVLAAELEWYLKDSQNRPVTHQQIDVDRFFNKLRENSANAGLVLESLDLERGPGQLEAALPQTRHAAMLARQLNLLKLMVYDTAAIFGLMADFSAKPYPDNYGSGIHFHVHLEDMVGNNLFWKEEDTLSEPLRHSLAGLLAKMQEDMDIFAPSEESRKRFVKGWHAPVSASWGGNNRTVALRLPDGSANIEGVELLALHPRARTRRIEHRVAGADADPEAVINAVVAAIAYGLEKNPDLPAPVFGDAGDEQYLTAENALLG